MCESIDRFVPDDVRHYIFVNDEDFDLFCNSNITGRHIIRKKSEILPSGLIRVPFKLLGHHYHVSAYSIPVREWIIQQICKLGAFDVIDGDVDAIINIDSETVFMRKFSINDIYDSETRKFILYKNYNVNEPCHLQYCQVAKKLLDVDVEIEEISKYCYMAHPVIFVRENINNLVSSISRKSIFGNWKMKLCNTYRFSEYYMYGIFSDYVYGLKNHYLSEKRLFPMVQVSDIASAEQLKERIVEKMADNAIFGVWLQKHNRTKQNYNHIQFEEISKAVHELWTE